MTGVLAVAGYALRESIRRRVFLVVALLTLLFLFLYRLGAGAVADEVDEIGAPAGIDSAEVLGATLLGLAMFGTLFLACVLAVFLTLGAVRADAERGLLQPLVVRPVGRAGVLAGRFAGAAAVCSAYVVAVFGATILITGEAVGWWPDRIVVPALELAAAVIVLVALSLLGSVFLSATANGVAVFMLFGAGLVAGLLGQLGEALDADTLTTWSERTSWALPFEALYQDALGQITADTVGLTRYIVQLGPFGGGQDYGGELVLWTAGYLATVGSVAAAAFARLDL
jgi:ABC-type transport system involved in multi-copper enzyme maturation permease subunit